MQKDPVYVTCVHLCKLIVSSVIAGLVISLSQHQNFDESEEERARRLVQNKNEDRGPKSSLHPVNFCDKIDEICNMF